MHRTIVLFTIAFVIYSLAGLVAAIFGLIGLLIVSAIIWSRTGRKAQDLALGRVTIKSFAFNARMGQIRGESLNRMQSTILEMSGPTVWLWYPTDAQVRTFMTLVPEWRTVAIVG
jgi:hypothetical protein